MAEAVAVAGGSSFFLPVPGPYCPINDPSSVNRPGSNLKRLARI